MRVQWLGLLAFVAACGGASDSGLFSGAGSSGQPTPSDTSASGGTPPPPGATTPPPPGAPPPPPPPGCTNPRTYYEDTDGDGFGGTTTKQACTSPGDGWVTKGGDCDDGDPSVFPGQSKYFASAYTSSATGLDSFDYNCSTHEEEQPPGYKAASMCTAGLTIGTCTGDGYLPSDARPAAPGIDRICGSTKVQTCTFKQGQGCLSAVIDATPALCH